MTKEQDRVKEIRTKLNMTMELFGKRLGVTRTAISNIEGGYRNLTEQMKKAICREFHVSYAWLTNGDGDMFSNSDAAIKEKVDQIMESENDFHKKLIESIIDLDDETLIMLKTLIDKLANKKAD